MSYIEFTITPDVDYQVSLATISFDYYTQSSYSTATFDNTFTVRSSLDGFANDIGAGWTMTGTNSGVFGSTGNITLSDFDDIDSAITFRLYAQKTTSNYPGGAGGTYSNSAEISRWDNITVEGSVAFIPEPSTSLLGCLGLLALLRRRR